ncbi:MAG: class II aldolase/adducin family protein [Lachnospiraceae bacterium]|nr:class II aldolase/adducin family protein [Lachnospiraceae bacterium]
MNGYMQPDEAKKAILDIGRRMYERDFVAANDGNISIRIGDNSVLSTPTGVSKGFMNEEMLVVTDLDGNLIEGTSKPSSELKMHLRVYKENPDVRSVCHAHPVFCTAYSVVGNSLSEPILAEAILTLGDVPVLPYAELGTEEVPNVIAPYINTHYGVILANHGVVTWASEPYKAFYRLESMEHYAKITFITDLVSKDKRVLNKEQIEALKKKAFDL